MAVSEKQVPRALSFASMGAGVLLSFVLFSVGVRNPRESVGMAINHHTGYGTNVACYECHIPVADSVLKKTTLSCVSMNCHPELQSGTSHEEAVRLFSTAEARAHFPDREERAEYHLALHKVQAEAACITCHTEHTSRPKIYPEGWQKYTPDWRAKVSGRQVSWVSIVEGRPAGP